jgi:hypothetical protein
MATHGFPAFDYGLQKEVLVMSMVLRVLGDSPMHAEITNTPLPGAALNPCRICHLGVSSRAQKSEADFIYQFLGMDAHGNRVCHWVARLIICMNKRFIICMNKRFIICMNKS